MKCSSLKLKRQMRNLVRKGNANICSTRLELLMSHLTSGTMWNRVSSQGKGSSKDRNMMTLG
jgi:hypothetical protein